MSKSEVLARLGYIEAQSDKIRASTKDDEVRQLAGLVADMSRYVKRYLRELKEPKR